MWDYPKWQGFYGMEHTPKRTQMPHTLQTAHILKQLKELISWTLTKKQFIILVPISNIQKKLRDLKRWGTDIEPPPRHHTVEHTQCESESFSQSCLTLCDLMDCRRPGSSVHVDSPGKNTGVGGHFLLQVIFLTQGSNLYCWQILYHLSH